MVPHGLFRDIHHFILKAVGDWFPDHRNTEKARVSTKSEYSLAGQDSNVSAWLSMQSRPFCWYSLDEWDNDLTQFFAYLAAGISAISEQVSAQLQQMLDAYQSIGPEGFLKGFIDQLHAIESPFILVFDDYQVIQNNQIHQILRALMDHMPKGMQLVFITREDPPHPLAKLRANKKLLEIRISDLKFTDNEVRTFFLQQLNLPLPEEQLLLICKRTEGWIAGLQLTALSFPWKRRGNGTATTTSFGIFCVNVLNNCRRKMSETCITMQARGSKQKGGIRKRFITC